MGDERTESRSGGRIENNNRPVVATRVNIPSVEVMGKTVHETFVTSERGSRLATVNIPYLHRDHANKT